MSDAIDRLHKVQLVLTGNVAFMKARDAFRDALPRSWSRHTDRFFHYIVDRRMRRVVKLLSPNEGELTVR